MRADRLIALMLKLQKSGYVRTTELADELGVSRRTILRDIEALSQVGIPLVTQPGPGGGISLDEQYRISLTGLREAEVRTLFLSANANLMKDIGLEVEAEQMLLKLFASLPTVHQQAVKQLQQRLHIDPDWWFNNHRAAFMTEIFEAVNLSCQLQVVYKRDAGEAVERLLEPYGLVAKAGTWYLIAKRDGEFRTYRISRFLTVKRLESNFQRQQDFNLEAFWETSSKNFIQTLLKFSYTLKIHSHKKVFVDQNSVGRYELIEVETDEEWFVARFEAASIETAMMFTFGLGSDAIVIEPQELIEALQARMQELSRIYA